MILTEKEIIEKEKRMNDISLNIYILFEELDNPKCLIFREGVISKEISKLMNEYVKIHSELVY